MLDRLLGENDDPFSPQSGKHHSQFQNHILTCTVSLFFRFSCFVPLVVRRKQNACKTNVAVLLQVMFELLNNGIAGCGKICKNNRFKTHSSENKFQAVTDSRVVSVNNEDPLVWPARRCTVF